ncbi:hypothetical protein GCM10010191_53850 [Actinomadura vinacea]|uniref:DUF3558 domain-containing protein n=1 Tax=Actinomadura vinacea TaxID=115336 RepID=A0ABN3JN96_9ACTN
MLRSLAAILAVSLLTACGGGSPDAAESEAPPLSEVSKAPPPPSSTRTPGPAIKAACPLLPPSRLVSVLGARKPVPNEDPGGPAARICRYVSASGGMTLIVATEPAGGSADQMAARVIQRYSGTLEKVPDLGDAAYYSNGQGGQIMVVSRAEGPQMRTVTFMCRLPGEPRDKLVPLLRGVLERI